MHFNILVCYLLQWKVSTAEFIPLRGNILYYNTLEGDGVEHVI